MFTLSHKWLLQFKLLLSALDPENIKVPFHAILKKLLRTQRRVRFQNAPNSRDGWMGVIATPNCNQGDFFTLSKV